MSSPRGCCGIAGIPLATDFLPAPATLTSRRAAPDRATSDSRVFFEAMVNC